MGVTPKFLQLTNLIGPAAKKEKEKTCKFRNSSKYFFAWGRCRATPLGQVYRWELWANRLG